MAAVLEDVELVFLQCKGSAKLITLPVNTDNTTILLIVQCVDNIVNVLMSISMSIRRWRWVIDNLSIIIGGIPIHARIVIRYHYSKIFLLLAHFCNLFGQLLYSVILHCVHGNAIVLSCDEWIFSNWIFFLGLLVIYSGQWVAPSCWIFNETFKTEIVRARSLEEYEIFLIKGDNWRNLVTR